MKGFYDQFEGELEGHALVPEDLKGGALTFILKKLVMKRKRNYLWENLQKIFSLLFGIEIRHPLFL